MLQFTQSLQNASKKHAYQSQIYESTTSYLIIQVTAYSQLKNFFISICKLQYIRSAVCIEKQDIWYLYSNRRHQSSHLSARRTTKGLFGRAPALPKTAPAPALQMERLLWWSWSRFRKYLAKQLHLLD